MITDCSETVPFHSQVAFVHSKAKTVNTSAEKSFQISMELHAENLIYLSNTEDLIA
jgi:acetylglutamate kinase